MISQVSLGTRDTSVAFTKMLPDVKAYIGSQRAQYLNPPKVCELRNKFRWEGPIGDYIGIWRDRLRDIMPIQSRAHLEQWLLVPFLEVVGYAVAYFWGVATP